MSRFLGNIGVFVAIAVLWVPLLIVQAAASAVLERVAAVLGAIQ